MLTAASARTSLAGDVLVRCRSLLSFYNARAFSTEEHIKDEQSIVGGYTPVTKQLWAERLKWTPTALKQAPSVDEVIPKKAKRISVSYPFSTDKGLKEMYRNPWGFVRTGRLLEDLDSLAGNIAFDHCYAGRSPEARPPLLVTASVDAITLQEPLPITQDLVMGGQVVWTGTSSLDICMEVAAKDRPDRPSMVALFSFVALDPVTKRAQPVNPVVPASPREEEQFGERQAVSEHRRGERQRQKAAGPSLLPGGGLRAEVLRRVEELVQEGRRAVDMPGLAPGDIILCRDTTLQNAFVCQPQQRNMHGRVFGGFLMRRAFELAFATTYMYAGARPMFLEVDEVTFKSPVDIGDLLRLRSWVLVSHPDPQDRGRSLVRVEVVASVTRPEDVASRETNTFAFVFAVVAPPSRPLKRVLPATHLEALHMAPYLPEAGSLS